MTKEEKIKTEELLSRLRRVNIDIRKNNSNTEYIKASLGNGSSPKEIQKLIDEGVPRNFIIPYNHFFEYSLKWEAKPETGIKTGGFVNILKLPDIFSDWEGQVYLDNFPEDSILRDFKPVDYHSENGAGIYFGKNKTDFTFHYGELDGSELRSLDLDINGYIEMMIMSKGCYGWQRVIEYQLYGGYYKEYTERFKENMPKLFHDWTWEGWLQKFEEVRLNKVK